MKISLVIATYQRPNPLRKLLDSIGKQTIKPFEVIVVDASDNELTKIIFENRTFDLNVNYQEVSFEHKGSAQQRNYGVKLVDKESDIIAFLDDDLVVEPDYFEKILETYKNYPDAIGVGGIDLNNNNYFRKKEGIKYNEFNYYELDGWVVKEPLRIKARKLFGLMTNLQPGLIPEYSHGRSSLPPNGKIYEVEHFMGCIASFRKELFDKIKFSEYFVGYGLYEDFYCCVRALAYGKLYVNTNAKVWHYHEPSGRPDFFKYGRMVVRNGWYVWRVRFPHPSFKARFKWHATTLLLAIIRLMNVITGPSRKNAFLDFTGRMVGWFGVIFNPPERKD